MLQALIVPMELRRELIDHAERESPMEAIGMLGGRGTRAIRVVPLRNRAADPHAFFADPYEQFLAERLFARVGLKIVALYHSHPGGGAHPAPIAARRTCAHIGGPKAACGRSQFSRNVIGCVYLNRSGASPGLRETIRSAGVAVSSPASP
jgi:hypothetical protein